MSDTHAQTVAFVRDTMLPEKEPPLTEKGAVKWLRENLFSGWLNIGLTIVSVYVILVALSHVIPWVFGGIWNATSLTECREIAGDAHVACWGVIADRWSQLMFGFYPETYARPVLAFVVLLTAVLPVLFSEMPRKLLWYSAASPFLIYFLIWGGTIWGPIFVAAGFGVAAGGYILGARFVNALVGVIAAIVLPVLYWLLLAGPLTAGFSAVAPIGIAFVESSDMGGFMLSIIIGVAGIVLSLPLGILLALGRQSDLLILNKSSVFVIEVIRGVPLIVWLFTASLLLNYFLPPGTNFDLTLRVIIMVTLFASAYIAEVVRGGLAALPKGQYEAADALGLDYWKSMRLIILPQALKISIPGIVNTFIGLFKDTTLVVFIGLLDPIGLTNAIRATTDWNGIYWELFAFVGLLFFIFCFTMGQYSLFLEKKLQREHR